MASEGQTSSAVQALAGIFAGAGFSLALTSRTLVPRSAGFVLFLLGTARLTLEVYVGRGNRRALRLTGVLRRAQFRLGVLLHLRNEDYRTRLDAPTQQRPHEAPPRYIGPVYSPESEYEAVDTLRAKVHCATLVGTSTHCQFYPRDSWGPTNYRPTFYCDESQVERPHLVRASVDDSVPLPVTPEVFLAELESLSQSPELKPVQAALAANVLEDVIQHGMNGYPRYVGLPTVVRGDLVIPLARNFYGVHQLATRGLMIPSWPQDSSPFSLGVRVAVTYRRAGRTFALFHQRSTENGDYAYAWDIGAAGYLNPDEKQPDVTMPDGLLSPFAQAQHECFEELGFPSIGTGSNPEMMEFFGVTRDTRLGTTTLCGEWRMPSSLPPPDLEALNGGRLSRKVREIRECELTPDAFARFITELEPGPGGRPRMVAEALLLTVLVLSSHSFDWSDIEDVFDFFGVMKRVDLQPSVA